MRRPARRLLAHVLVAALVAALAPGALRAQHADDLRHVSALPQWEWRADATAAESPDVHAGLGLNVRAGWYVRVGAAVAAGATRGADDVWRGSQRVDVAARFLLDPFRERPRALYAGGGVSARFVEGRADPVLTLLAGLEGRARKHYTPSVELTLGGGLRLGVVLRRTRPGPSR